MRHFSIARVGWVLAVPYIFGTLGSLSCGFLADHLHRRGMDAINSRKLPICIAKTQYSFSDNPKLLGAPTGWTLNITDAALSAGAGFIVAIAGNMMLMPGLPKVSRAATVDVNAKGEIIGI